MHRGPPSGNYSNSLDDLDRELALLRQKRELLEGQQNQLRGGRGRGGRAARGPQGGNVHPISPWDNNAAIQPLFNNASNYNPQNSSGGFNYTNLYEDSSRDQFRPPRRNQIRKRVQPSTWNDRPNSTQDRLPPRKRSRPNPPAEQSRFPSGPRTPNNNARSDSNRSSYHERSTQSNRGNSAPHNPPANITSRANKKRSDGSRVGTPSVGKEDILRANTEPNPKVRGRLEHALGVILQKMRSTFPDKEVLFKDPLSCKAMKQMLRDRIKGLLIGKTVGSPNEIVLVYRESFPNDDDIIKSVDSLISTTAEKVASKLDKKVKKEDKPTAAAPPAASKRGASATVAKQNSGATAVKSSSHHSHPKRYPEADAILSHFKDNLSWAIDTELRLMFDNLKELYKDQPATEVNIRASIKKIVAIQRARFEEELNKPTSTPEKADNTKVDESQADTSVDANKTSEADKNETSDGKDPKTAENGEATIENGGGDAEKVLNQAEKVQDQAEKVQDQAEKVQDQAEKVHDQAEKVQDQAEAGPEKNADIAIDPEVEAKEAELNKASGEIQRLCNYVLGIWLSKQLPLILPRFREHVTKMVRTSLFERVQEETGNKEVSIPARAAAATQSSDQERYYVSLVGRPKLPKRPKLSSFLWRFNPCSVKRHKSIFNLLFVGFSNKEDYDSILESSSEVTFGTCKVYIKPSKARPSNEENARLLNSANSAETDDIIIVEDRQGTDETTDGQPIQIKTNGDDSKMEVDFSEDVTTSKQADKKDDAKEKEVSIKDEEDVTKENNDKTADGEKTAEEKEDNFLDNMLDGAIVLDSVGDDDDELLFVENPEKDCQINVEVDLDETIILADDVDKTTDGAEEKTIDSAQEKTIDGAQDKTIDVSENKTTDDAEDKTIAPTENSVEVIDEKKVDNAKQETQANKDAGVTTRRSTRLNN